MFKERGKDKELSRGCCVQSDAAERDGWDGRKEERTWRELIGGEGEQNRMNCLIERRLCTYQRRNATVIF